MSPLDALLISMRSRDREGDLVGALALYDEAPAELRAEPLALYARGTLLYTAARFPEAEASFRAALADAPGTPDFVVNLAMALLAQQQAEEALQLLATVNASDPRAAALAPTIAHLVEVGQRIVATGA